MLWPEVSQICTEWMEWMSHRERKLSSSRQPGTAGPGNILGCCLVSLHFLCDIHYIHSVAYFQYLPGVVSFWTTLCIFFFTLSSAFPKLLGKEGPSLEIRRGVLLATFLPSV